MSSIDIKKRFNVSKDLKKKTVLYVKGVSEKFKKLQHKFFE